MLKLERFDSSPLHMITIQDIGKRAFLWLENDEGVPRWENTGAKIASATHSGLVLIKMPCGDMCRVSEENVRAWNHGC
jgi:hypothetical protein